MNEIEFQGFLLEKLSKGFGENLAIYLSEGITGLQLVVCEGLLVFNNDYFIGFGDYYFRITNKHIFDMRKNFFLTRNSRKHNQFFKEYAENFADILPQNTILGIINDKIFIRTIDTEYCYNISDIYEPYLQFKQKQYKSMILSHEFDETSFFYKEYLPLDMLKEIKKKI